LLDVLKEGFAGIAVIPRTEAAKMGEGFRVLPVDMALPDYHLSLVCPKPVANPVLIEQLLAVWAAAL